MAVMLSKTYDAFMAAGAGDEKARAAAEEIAGYDSRLAKIDSRLAKIEGQLGLMTWVIGLIFAFMLAGFGVTFTMLFQMTRQLSAISAHLGLQ